MAPSRKRAAGKGEASDEREGTGRSLADEPQGDVGVAAALSPPPVPAVAPAVLKAVIASRDGVCLHYEVDGVYFRENLTVARCESRIEAMAHAPDQLALWGWKLEQIQTHRPS